MVSLARLHYSLSFSKYNIIIIEIFFPSHSLSLSLLLMKIIKKASFYCFEKLNWVTKVVVANEKKSDDLDETTKRLSYVIKEARFKIGRVYKYFIRDNISISALSFGDSF